jgi:hypothetical protein
MAKKQSDPIPDEVKFDPRIKDLVRFNRIRDLVDKEILHQAWGCQLWALERLDKITKEQRMAGDAYIHLTDAHRNVIYSPTTAFEPDEAMRADRIKGRYRDSQDLLKHGDVKIRRAVDELVFEDLHPGCEADLKRVRDGLSRLEIFFGIGRNKT